MRNTKRPRRMLNERALIVLIGLVLWFGFWAFFWPVRSDISDMLLFRTPAGIGAYVMVLVFVLIGPAVTLGGLIAWYLSARAPRRLDQS